MDTAARTRRPLFLTTLAAGLWAVLGLALLVLGPKYERIFTDFGVELPGLTLLFVNGARWLAGTQSGQSVPGWPIAAGALVVLTLACSTLAACRPTRSLGLGLLSLLIFSAVAAFFLAVVAYVLPLTKLIESMQQSAPASTAPAAAPPPVPAATGAPTTPAGR